jgi:hypothetical protein
LADERMQNLSWHDIYGRNQRKIVFPLPCIVPARNRILCILRPWEVSSVSELSFGELSDLPWDVLCRWSDCERDVHALRLSRRSQQYPPLTGIVQYLPRRLHRRCEQLDCGSSTDRR